MEKDRNKSTRERGSSWYVYGDGARIQKRRKENGI